MAKIKYFYRDQELVRISSVYNEKFAERFPGVKGMATDNYNKVIGYTADRRGPFPAERRITYKAYPSRHECNAKCMGGNPNGTCECSCGGKNHGLGAILQLNR